MIAGTCVRAAETTILEVGQQQGRPCTFPVVRARNVYVLPGVPELLRQKWQVRPCSVEHSKSDPSLTRQILIYLDDVGLQMHSLGVGGIGRAQAPAAHVASVISVSSGPEATLVSPVKTNCWHACIGSKCFEALDSLQAPLQETLPLNPTMTAGAWR